MTGLPTSGERRARLLAIGWAAVLAAALLAGPMAGSAAGADPTPTPSSDPSATPTPTPSPTPPPPVVITYRTSLLRSGDFTRQYTKFQCVGASLQTMRNMIWSHNNRGPYLQKRLTRIARANSRYRADGGSDPYGWATATSLAGHGRYVLIAAPTMAGAVMAAAKGMAATHRPAGIVVWHGTHAWVLTGFEATADPTQTDDFQVVTVRIADPLWPYYHSSKHRIYRPGTQLYLSTLRKNYTPYHDARRDDRIEGLFVAIVPLAEGAALPSGGWESNSAAAPTPSPSPLPSPSPEPTPTAEPTPTPSPGA